MRAQLLAPILVATAGLAVLGTVQTNTAVSAARDAERARTLSETAIGTVRLVHEIDRELAESVALRQRGGKAGAQLVTAQRERTNKAAEKYRTASRRAHGAAPGLAGPLDAAAAALDSLASTRATSVTGGTASNAASDRAYQSLVASLLDVADALPLHIADPKLANDARAVAVIAAIEHFDAQERAMLRAIFARGAAEPGELISLANLVGQRDEHYLEFGRAADAAARARYEALVQGSDVDTTDRIRDAVLNSERDASGLKVDPDTWYTVSSNTIRRVNLVGLQLSDRLADAASARARIAQRRALGTGFGTLGITLAALLTAILLAVRTSRRLRRLRAAALAVARRELPEAILAVASGGTVPPAPRPAGAGPSAMAVARGLAASNDEIGEVADAFATVHRSALRLAGEQAELRLDISRMAEILARRIRTLITRQLRLLDEFEREETDPDALARLFALDHLAARLRRNGENLLVLAGGEPGRAFSQTFPLAAVVTAAASEIEDFARVEAIAGDIMIAGPVVGDLVHLLAELLENATSFSPPDTPVRVDARRTVDGAVVRVHDSGIGIAAPRLAEINARLVQPVTLTSAAAGTMGLHVVAHLASRHGIRVQLHPTGTGTVAYVALPHAALSDQPLPSPSHGAGDDADLTVRPGRFAGRDGRGGAAAGLGIGDTGEYPGHAPVREPALGAVATGAPLSAGYATPVELVPSQRVPSQRVPTPLVPSQRVPAQLAPARMATVGPAGDHDLAVTGSATGPLPVRPTSPSSGTPAEGPTAERTAAWFAPRLGDGEHGSAWPLITAPVTGAPRVGGTTSGMPVVPPATGGRPPVGGPSSGRPDGGAVGPNGLPRRDPGAMLAPEVTAPQSPPGGPAPVDPEAVRARLSAFAEGVSAALRRGPAPSPASKDR